MRNGERGLRNQRRASSFRVPNSKFRIPPGGLLSVALSRPLAIGTGSTNRYRGWELPTTAPYEARTFLSPRMASDRPDDRRTELAWYRPNVPLRRECEQSVRTEINPGGRNHHSAIEVSRLRLQSHVRFPDLRADSVQNVYSHSSRCGNFRRAPLQSPQWALFLRFAQMPKMHAHSNPPREIHP